MRPLQSVVGTRVFLLEGNNKLTDDIGTIADVAINKDDGSFWSKEENSWQKKFNFSLGNNIPLNFDDILFPLVFEGHNECDITNILELIQPKQLIHGIPLFYVCLDNPQNNQIIIKNNNIQYKISGIFKTGKVFKIQGPDSNGEYTALQPDQ